MSVEVAPVSSRRDVREFIELPFRLHSNAEQWIPPLRIERHLFLNPRTGPFFKHGEAQLFLARRDGRVVGRVSAQIDRDFNEFQGNAWGMFGFLELEDDIEVMRALLDAAAGWLRERGRDRMVGPMDFTMNDESGVLIEGFELEPMVRQAWHPPYYQRLCEEAGLEKAVDTYMWSLHISGREKRDADHLGPRGEARAEARDPDPQDEPLAAAPGARRLRRDLQRGVGAQLRVRAVLEGRTSTPTPRSSSSSTTGPGS